MHRPVLRWFLYLCVSVIAPCFPLCSNAASLHTDDFQSGTTEGWIGGAEPTHQATGGPLGANDPFLMITSEGGTGPGSRLATYNNGADWVGNFADIHASSITVDLMNPQNSPPFDMRVVLFGPTAVNQRWTSSQSVSVPNDGIWRPYEFSLAENALSLVAGTSNYVDLMTSVVRVMLRHDSGTPSSSPNDIAGSLGIDNISLVTTRTNLQGDFDGNGKVDAADFTVWRDNLGAQDETTIHDNGDGQNGVDVEDYALWKDNYGESSQASAVPEAIPLWPLAILTAVISRRGVRFQLADLPPTNRTRTQ